MDLLTVFVDNKKLLISKKMSISHLKPIAFVVIGICLLSQINGTILPGDLESSFCNDNSVIVNGVGKVSV